MSVDRTSPYWRVARSVDRVDEARCAIRILELLLEDAQGDLGGTDETLER